MKPSRKRAAKSVNTHGSPLCFLNARTGDAGGSRIVALRVQNEFYRYTPQYPQVCMYRRLVGFFLEPTGTATRRAFKP